VPKSILLTDELLMIADDTLAGQDWIHALILEAGALMQNYFTESCRSTNFASTNCLSFPAVL
jgi:hypothetical protein